MIPQAPGKALEGFRVVELGDGGGQYCGRLLADLGADVIKVEPPQGDITRSYPPFKGDVPHPEGSLHFAYYNANKRGMVLDLDQARDREALGQLLRQADVLIESLPSGRLTAWGLTFQELHYLNPELVVASLSGFGRSGPYRDYAAPDIVCQAMGGMMYISGHPAAPPVATPLGLAHHLASIHLCFGILVALYMRRSSGLGQYVEVSVQEVLASQRYLVVNYSSNRLIGARQRTGGAAAPSGMYPAQDGYVNLHIMAPGHWKAFLEWIGSPEALRDPVWENRHFRALNTDVLDPYVVEFTRQHTKARLFQEGQDHHLPVGPVNTPEDFILDPHVRERGYFREVKHPELGRTFFPGPPYRLSESPCQVQRPAPALGQHTQEVLGPLAPGEKTSRNAPSPTDGAPTHRPFFSGVRVLDLTQAIAGPYLTRFLGEHGAQVIKVESSAHQQRGRYSPHLGRQVFLQQQVTFADANRNKLSIAINLNTQAGQELFRHLVRVSDVVAENFSPRVMQRWGLDYPRLREIREDLIMVSLPGFGLSGPYREYVSVARIVMALAGLVHLWGFPGHPEHAASESWLPNYAAGIHAAVAVAAALHYRERTGQGQNIDLAQLESLASLMGPAYLEYFVKHRIMGPLGNRSARGAPHGCYPCKGEDRWCVIAIESEEAWQRFCQVLGNPTWTKDPKYAKASHRLAHQEELDRHVAEWTQGYTPHQVMGILQREGIPAGAVQTAEDLYFDLHLRHRGFLVEVEDPEVGAVVYPGTMVRLSGTPGEFRPCASLAQHQEYVFGDLLGLSSEEVERLTEEGGLV